MNNKLLGIIVVTILMVMGNHARAALVLDIDGNGQLLGASNVDVNGSLYNVEFLDGACTALFDGCDESSDFVFQTEIDAIAASQSLLDLVFINSPLGDFDTSPELTNGCSFAGLCNALTIFGESLITPGTASSLFAENNVTILGDVVNGRFTFSTAIFDTSGGTALTLARWSLASEVHEPSIAALFALGLMGLVARRVKK